MHVCVWTAGRYLMRILQLHSHTAKSISPSPVTQRYPKRAGNTVPQGFLCGMWTWPHYFNKKQQQKNKRNKGKMMWTQTYCYLTPVFTVCALPWHFDLSAAIFLVAATIELMSGFMYQHDFVKTKLASSYFFFMGDQICIVTLYKTTLIAECPFKIRFDYTLNNKKKKEKGP